MIWLIGILSSLAGAVIWALLSKAYRLYSARRGDLAGYFYQITYRSKDKILSIELVQVRHSKRSDTLSGTWWRLYNTDEEHRNMSRRWDFDAWLLRGGIKGVYRSTRGNGLAGNFKLTYANHDYLHGKFDADEARPDDSFVTMSADFIAPMEWRRVGADSQENEERVIITLLKTIPQGELLEYLPGSVQRVLKARLNATYHIRRSAERLIFGSGAFDPHGPLARQQQENEVRERLSRSSVEGDPAILKSQPPASQPIKNVANDPDDMSESE
jgi:hypothetical protein